MRRVTGTILAILGCFAASAQPPAFEVASVKRSTEPNTGGYRHQITPDSLTMLHVSMGYCIRLAYGTSRSYDLAGPAWIDPPTDVLVDIVAKAGKPVPQDEIKLMLQTLLAERFKLAVHHEKRSLPAYELTVAKDNPALRRSAAGTEPKGLPATKPYEVRYQGISMAQFAQHLSPPNTTRPVVDMTGLEGRFDLTLDLGRYILDPATGKPVTDAIGRVDVETAYLRAVRDQLGLTLQPGHAPVEVLVIDHVEKVPTGN
jgi:uncharacterized protein (TIGR03435 family)